MDGNKIVRSTYIFVQLTVHITGQLQHLICIGNFFCLFVLYCSYRHVLYASNLHQEIYPPKELPLILK